MRELIECETRGGFHTSFGRAKPCTLLSEKMRDGVYPERSRRVPVRKWVVAEIFSPNDPVPLPAREGVRG